MNHRISKYFDIRELVCPHVYDRFGDYAWNFFDPRLFDVVLVIREGVNRRIFANNWHKGGSFDERGFRCNICSLVKEKTALEKLYIPAHFQGMGLDFDIEGMTAKESREWIKDNQTLLPHPIRLESDVNWVHLDVRTDGMQTITFFKG